MTTILRRLKGAVGNAVVWAATWFGSTFALWSTLTIFGVFGAIPNVWSLLLLAAAQTGVTGFFTGLVFSVYLGIAHKDRPILEIGIGRCALIGAGLATIWPLTTTLIWAAAVGFPLPPLLLLATIAPSTVLGAVTAGGSVAAARWGELRSLEEERRRALGLGIE